MRKTSIGSFSQMIQSPISLWVVKLSSDDHPKHVYIKKFMTILQFISCLLVIRKEEEFLRRLKDVMITVRLRQNTESYVSVCLVIVLV